MEIAILLKEIISIHMYYIILYIYVYVYIYVCIYIYTYDVQCTTHTMFDTYNVRVDVRHTMYVMYTRSYYRQGDITRPHDTPP